MAEPPKAKKPKRVCHFDREWTKEFPGIGTSSKGKLAVPVAYYLEYVAILHCMCKKVQYQLCTNNSTTFSCFSIIESQFSMLSHFDHISELVSCYLPLIF